MEGADRAFGDRHLVALAGAVIGDGEGVLGHGLLALIFLSTLALGVSEPSPSRPAAQDFLPLSWPRRRVLAWARDGYAQHGSRGTAAHPGDDRLRLARHAFGAVGGGMRRQ